MMTSSFHDSKDPCVPILGDIISKHRSMKNTELKLTLASCDGHFEIFFPEQYKNMISNLRSCIENTNVFKKTPSLQVVSTYETGIRTTSDAKPNGIRETVREKCLQCVEMLSQNRSLHLRATLSLLEQVDTHTLKEQQVFRKAPKYLQIVSKFEYDTSISRPCDVKSSEICKRHGVESTHRVFPSKMDLKVIIGYYSSKGKNKKAAVENGNNTYRVDIVFNFHPLLKQKNRKLESDVNNLLAQICFDIARSFLGASSSPRASSSPPPPSQQTSDIDQQEPTLYIMRHHTNNI
jgi:hypothetical protein